MQDNQKMEQPPMQPVDSSELKAVEGGVTVRQQDGLRLAGDGNPTSPNPLGGRPVGYTEIEWT